MHLLFGVLRYISLMKLSATCGCAFAERLRSDPALVTHPRLLERGGTARGAPRLSCVEPPALHNVRSHIHLDRSHTAAGAARGRDFFGLWRIRTRDRGPYMYAGTAQGAALLYV